MSDANIVNPPNIAVALQYDGINAPKVTAKGRDNVATRILELAEEHNVPLHADTDLVKVLNTIPLGDEIPRELYVAIAEVIAFAYMLSGKMPNGWSGDGHQE